MLAWLPDDPQDRSPFPPASEALGPGTDTPGLLAAGGTLAPWRLEQAYRHGIFPWYGPRQLVLWWAPDPRMVLPVAQFRLHRSLRKTLRAFLAAPGCEIRIDSAFDAVIEACAETPRDGQAGTWIVPELRAAYRAWHRAGAVHSVETWVDGRLVGGLYGVGIGRMFFGESMFSHATDASKIALAALVAFCAVSNNDRVGLMGFSDRVERYVPPNKGVRHVLRLLRDILFFEPEHKGTDLAAALDRYGDVEVDTAKSMAVFHEWLKLARLEPRPGGLRRPLHFARAVKPTPESYKLR